MQADVRATSDPARSLIAGPFFCRPAHAFVQRVRRINAADDHDQCFMRSSSGALSIKTCLGPRRAPDSFGLYVPLLRRRACRPPQACPPWSSTIISQLSQYSLPSTEYAS